MKRLSHFECIRYNRDDIWERGQFAEITIDTNCAQYIKIYHRAGGMPLTKKQNHWSVLCYLIYFTQVGVSVVTPPILCCFAALWLKRRFALGNGTVIIGIVLGIAVAACSLRDFLRLTERKARESERKEKWH